MNDNDIVFDLWIDDHLKIKVALPINAEAQAEAEVLIYITSLQLEPEGAAEELSLHVQLAQNSIDAGLRMLEQNRIQISINTKSTEGTN